MAPRNDFVGELAVPVPRTEAWSALERMARWLPHLDTVRAVESDPGDPSSSDLTLRTGLRYLTRTGEGAVMRCRVLEADRDRGVARIEARLGPLRSRLRCGVRETGRDSCVLERRQTYPGIVGRLFTAVLGRREQEETTAYLRAWADDIAGGPGPTGTGPSAP